MNTIIYAVNSNHEDSKEKPTNFSFSSYDEEKVKTKSFKHIWIQTGITKESTYRKKFRDLFNMLRTETNN